MIKPSAQTRVFRVELVRMRRAIAKSLLRRSGIPTSRRLLSKVPANRSVQQIYEICDLHYKRSYSEQIPFARLKVRIKEEIVALKAGEFNAGNIRGSLNIDFIADDFAVKAEKLDKEIAVYVYCQAGGRSSKAMAQLIGMGFLSVYNLEGGYSSWVKETK